MTQFTSIRNGNKDIFKSFVVKSKQEEDLEKGIVFVKQEKDIVQSIDKKIERLRKAIALFEGNKKSLKVAIGEEPTEVRKIWSSYDDETKEYETYFAYKVDHRALRNSPEEDVVNEEPVLKVNNPIINNNAVDNGAILKERNKQAYNDICYKINRSLEDIKELDKIKRNLDSKSNKKHTLEIYELNRFGF